MGMGDIISWGGLITQAHVTCRESLDNGMSTSKLMANNSYCKSLSKENS